MLKSSSETPSRFKSNLVIVPVRAPFCNFSFLLFLRMADLCLPLCAGEDTFELHSVQLELEAVERRIRELLGKQAQLRKRKAMLETSRADAHKSRGKYAARC